jgi:hexokinase
MGKNIFDLSAEQLQYTAKSLNERINEGLEVSGKEILALPAYIIPKHSGKVKNEKVLVLDLGGTNYRAAIVKFDNGMPSIECIRRVDLSSLMRSESTTREMLFEKLIEPIKDLMKCDTPPIHIGYCFSYPANCMIDGDAVLLSWTKGVKVQGMVGEAVGKPFLDYLNKNGHFNFKGIKVINDTVASLFAGLVDSTEEKQNNQGGYDAYIGLIVGTGNNMAGFIHSDKIKKLDPGFKQKGDVPINLESGNFNPPFLTSYDYKVDRDSPNRGAQHFEKAISGAYLGELFKFVYPENEYEPNFDAQHLTTMIRYPGRYKKEYVRTAYQIYERSAKLVAASLAGFTSVLDKKSEQPVRNLQLTAEGGLFWSEFRKGETYKDIVMKELDLLMKELGHKNINIHVNRMEHANLTGTAIAALS